MNNSNKLIVICGLSGSGKTTLAKKLAEELPAVRYCPDDWMEDFGISLWDEKFRVKLEARLWKQAQEVLALGQSVIIEYGCWAKSERDEKLEGARKLGVRAELIYLNIPIDVIKQRLAKRGMEGDEILLEKAEENAKLFQAPTKSEAALYDAYIEQTFTDTP